MKIGMLAFGTDGEIEPHVALAKALAKSGHFIDLFLVSIRNRDYSHLNEISGISCIQSPYPEEVLEKEFKNTNFWEFTDYESGRFFERQYEVVKMILKRHSSRLSKNNDILIGNRQSRYLRYSADANNVPYLSLSFEHTWIRSGLYPPLGCKAGSIDENRKAWDEEESKANNWFLPEVNSVRALYKLPPSTDFYREVLFSNELNMVSFSKHLFNAELDWEPVHHPCGYFNTDNKAIDWEMPASLDHFLKISPIFISLGSLIDYESDLNTFHQLLIRAIEKAECKAVILSKWENSGEYNENIYCLKGFVNYPKIISRCKMVIHHGGVGTMHLVAAAGVPSLILAYGFDQFNNADLLIKAGICKHVVARKGLTSESLANAITDTLQDNNLFEKAVQTGAKISTEDGLKEAVRIIEQKFN